MCEVCGGKTRNKRLATKQLQDICVYMQYDLIKVDISIGNSMVSSAIWEKHARVSFSKTYKIARVPRTSAICAFLKNS